jgi:predicted AAA+ superfamily ATPase
VVDLQTTFGGGKTHSLLALWHLFSRRRPDQLPDEVRVLVGDDAADWLSEVRRVALVGTDLRAGESVRKRDGTGVNTMWGELAWQLGGADGYQIVAAADQARTSPGDALTELFRRYTPCAVLIDEWVAYARQLFGRDDLPGGSFDTHFTFAQKLTEAARAVDGVLVVVSIPASEGAGRKAEGDDEGEGRSDLEVGGFGGREALRRLKAVVGRMESPWRPASAEESFEIVRRRLFEPMTADAERQRDQVARALVELYRRNSADFPTECREPAYQRRVAAAYPIHPELFDRLYGDWSTLDRFQRTRGVLRLMAAVIHSLWTRGDHAPVILPASLPLDDTVVRTELTRHLDDNWAPVLDSEVDGARSLAVALDTEVPVLGRYQATRRVARTVFLGSAPTLRMPNRGLEATRVRLGCGLPGESVATYGDALNRLSGRSMYLNVEAGRYWYSTQPGVTRLAADRAERLRVHEQERLHDEIERRIRGQRNRGEFAGVHITRGASADVSDEAEARLVVLSPALPHIGKSEETAARSVAREVLDRRSNAAREMRNTLVFLAADHRRLDDLHTATADYLAWASVDDEAEALGLDGQQARQARERRDDANRVVDLRLAETYVWALAPSQPDPNDPIQLDELKVEGQGSLAERTSRRLVSEGVLYAQFPPTLLRRALEGPLASMWQDGHVRAGAVWDAFARYCYLPRLASMQVLLEAVAAGPSSLNWLQDGFAIADAYEDANNRYAGLVAGSFARATPNTLLVRPDVADAQLAAERPASENGEPQPQPAPDGDRTEPAAEAERVPRRFYGAITLDPERPTRSFGQVAEEVVRPLAALVGTDVDITVEVRAKNDAGFPSDVVRTVGENAQTLKFDSHEFEES